MVRTNSMRKRRYLAVADTLRRKIAALQTNSRLPSERELQRKFRVSRATVRRALAMLERSGLVTRERRHGTSVSPPKVVRSLSPLYSIEEDLKRQGAKSESRLLRYQPAVIPPEFVRQSLSLTPGATAGLLTLLRLVDDRVIAYDRRYFPPAVAALFDPVLLSDRPITEVVGEIAGSPVTSSDSEIEIHASTREVAETLGITPGNLIVTVTGTLYLNDGSPVQMVVMSYRVDRVRFKSSMRYAHAAGSGRWD
jgi:DNA-binding GntR family transcriptional regulator